MIGFAAHFFKKILYFGIVGNVAWEQRRFFSKSCRQFLHIFFQPLALVIENQPSAGGRPGLGNCPGDTALIRDTENNSHLSFQHWLRHTRSTILRRSENAATEICKIAWAACPTTQQSP